MKKAEKKPETSSQTVHIDQHPEIPYEISEPLPPIVSSDLCHTSPRIGYLSKSLPNFHMICLVTPDDNFQDEAEEALNEQYDRQIEEFYTSKRERVKSLRAEKIDSTSVLENVKGHVVLNVTGFSRESLISTSEEDEF